MVIVVYQPADEERDAAGGREGGEACVHGNETVDACVGCVIIQVEVGAEDEVRGEEVGFCEGAGEEGREEVRPCFSMLFDFSAAASYGLVTGIEVALEEVGTG